MPAEAIHLSALVDSIIGSRAERFLRPKALREAARVGAIFVDLPYFENFPVVVLKYILKRPVAQTKWGDQFHEKAPVALGVRFLQEARALRERPSSRAAGDWLLAMSLGYFSHLAVDAAIHPSVNRLARYRAETVGLTPARQHNEVEKFQSIIYHEERHGFDFMGEPFLAYYIGVQANALYQDAEISPKIFSSLAAVFGEAPAAQTVRAWARGYHQYGLLISSAAGKTIAPKPQKEEMYPEVYQSQREGFFPERFGVGVWRSRRYMDAALAFAEGELGEEALLQIAPEGSIDHPPYASETIES